jgi:HNH endonuclease
MTAILQSLQTFGFYSLILVASIAIGYILYKISPYWRKYKAWFLSSAAVIVFFLVYFGVQIGEPFVDLLPAPYQHILRLKQMVNQPNAQGPYEISEKSNPQEIKKHKRHVTNGVKKWVAANQKWTCAGCNQLLDETYEVDHHIPLHKGGSNEKENLRALCRNCHGKKTYGESLSGFQ